VAYREALFSLPYGPTYYRGFVDSAHAAGVSFPEPGERAPASVDARAAHRGNRSAALWLATVAGLSAVVSVGAGALAVDAKRDFDHTQVQRTAAEARDRYATYTAVSIAGAAIAVGSAIGAWVVWPTGRTTLGAAPVPDRQGTGIVLRLGGAW
jgi:hypothetical protein